MDEFPLLKEDEGIPLFFPFIPPNAIEEIQNTLSSRCIGQGPKVEKFEQYFQKKLNTNSNMVATGSGTDSLHLAYILAGIEKGEWDKIPFCKNCNGWAEYDYEEKVIDGHLVRSSPQYIYYNKIDKIKNWSKNFRGGHKIYLDEKT